LQGYLLKNKTRPREAVNEVTGWIEKERETRAKLKKEKEEREAKEKAEREEVGTRLPLPLGLSLTVLSQNRRKLKPRLIKLRYVAHWVQLYVV